MTNPLEQLPTATIKAWDYVNKKYVKVLVDGDYDGEWLSLYKWKVNPDGYVYYQERGQGGKMTYLHRLIMGEPENMRVVHINRNRLDNRSANLETLTAKEAISKYRKLPTYRRFGKTKPGVPGSSTYSKYRGVVKDSKSKSGKYHANITRKYILGSSGTEIHAALAYDKAAKEKWGDRAALNFPDGVPDEINQEERKARIIKALRAEGMKDDYINKLLDKPSDKPKERKLPDERYQAFCKQLGDEAKRMREQAGLTIEEMELKSKASGVSNGERNGMTLRTFLRVVDALGYEAEYLKIELKKGVN